MTSNTPTSTASIRTISAPVPAVAAVTAVAVAAVLTPLNGFRPLALDGLCALFPLLVRGLWGFCPVNP